MSQTPFINDYELTLGLPQTNMNGLSETSLLMYAGHYQWTSIARAIGRPLSQLATPDGLPVFFTYYYVAEQIPASRALRSFRVDDTLRFLSVLRHFKKATLDGEIVFSPAKELVPASKRAASFELNPKAL